MGGFKLKSKSGAKPFEKTQNYLIHTKKALSKINLNEYGRMGVVALSDATPKDSGESANAWGYEVIRDKDSVKIVWTNSNVVGYNTVPVVILIQYGHLSKDGVYVEGTDFINPALQPIFFDLANKLWKEVNEH